MASTDPKTATQGQWEDLADRVQSKAEIGTDLSTPSSVVFVQTANIANGAVTKDKLAISGIIDVFYPVGSYYETSDTAFDPSTSWGGTWTLVSTGIGWPVQPFTMLYNNPSGAYSGITLTDSVNNYDYIDVYFKTNDDYQGSKRCVGGATFDADLSGMQVNSSGSAHQKTSIFTFNGTSVSYPNQYRHVEINLIADTVASQDYILITKVVGVKTTSGANVAQRWHRTA